MFQYADAAIRDMNRRNLKSFARLRQLKFDELNILNAVESVYDKAVRVAKKKYLLIARMAFIDAMIAAGKSEKEAEKAADESITEDYIIEMLDEYDPVTLYQFEPEIERKKQRLVEALIASHKKTEEISKALRYLTLQLSQYADKSELEATLEGYREAGVKQVRWITQEDEKVCKTCFPRDGKVYDIDKVPPRPHYRCRCELEPLTDSGTMYKRNDPFLEKIGPISKYAPDEMNRIVQEAHDFGVEVINSSHSMLYAPGLHTGEPGQLKVGTEDSLGAWLHEEQHMLDDEKDGWGGFLGAIDVERHCQMEYNAFGREIALAQSLGFEDVVEELIRECQESIIKEGGVWDEEKLWESVGS